MNEKRNMSIDLVKIIGMYMVIMLHTGVCRSSAGYQNVPSIYMISGIAIPLFFMVSGYLLSEKTVSMKYCMKKILGIVRFSFIICSLFDLIKYLGTGILEFSFPQCFIKEGTFSVFWYFGSMIIIYMVLPFLLNIIQSSRFNILLVLLLVFDLLIFVFNYLYSVEEYVMNTFRIWNWLLYFMLGTTVRKYKIAYSMIKWYYPLIFCALFIISVISGQQKSYELHFSSPICILYALTTFVVVERMDLSQNKITEVSHTPRSSCTCDLTSNLYC